MTVSVLIAGILAYLLGSIPTSVWYGQAFFGIDVRNHGSGNAGATNTFRVLGKRAGTIVLLIDVLKGWIAANLALILFYLGEISMDERVPMKLAFGIIAVIGHLFPVFANFKGGKGVATLLGMVLSIHPEAAGACIAVFVLVMISSRYVSLSSILATLSFPLMMVFGLFGPESNLLIIFGFVLFALIVYTHHKNIGRLLRGEESRVPIGRRRSR
ncbi:glycerol-3-phosphate 1-O-acyltransferase PlsY [Siphonobacter aquaeclarae]|jgi:glycerol-3-phosphate acyltransferase PlsY|uniref:Glycerol-3-phosphate acyltransferase n=1 Tax=Siphonobacter aquaeclarae TaxID=563176 RepID=A0A1G9W597_9BACT|nr:glycerol-3-phosphate 1-O-acyltransferase PlsY [Siphonobacter aquaeclarae]MBO9638212.1 glycerol-3-phosphate 1-O-acyltransferase PlsY [Siphonobacter aquaeclarae]SDM79698.1 acyl-phosphate glycerol-3-phosphate acyltransferase [Siphonobacter aquaeclarae]